MTMESNYTLGVETTLGLKKNTVKSTLLNLQCRPVPITIHYDMNYVYEITLYVICEMYNFIICEIYYSIFIYENSHTKLQKFTYEMDFICEISFFICELYNFIFDLIFIYENSYMN